MDNVSVYVAFFYSFMIRLMCIQWNNIGLKLCTQYRYLYSNYRRGRLNLRWGECYGSTLQSTFRISHLPVNFAVKFAVNLAAVFVLF